MSLDRGVKLFGQGLFKIVLQKQLRQHPESFKCLLTIQRKLSPLTTQQKTFHQLIQYGSTPIKHKNIALFVKKVKKRGNKLKMEYFCKTWFNIL